MLLVQGNRTQKELHEGTINKNFQPINKDKFNFRKQEEKNTKPTTVSEIQNDICNTSIKTEMKI